MEDNINNFPLAFVTGSGHRLGREIAINLAMQGYAVVVHFNRSQAKAEETLDIIKKLEVPAMLFQADLTKEDQIERLFEQIDALEYPLEVVVNSAGVMFHNDLFSTTTEAWDLTLDLNLKAVWLCSRLAYLQMQAYGGSIINISDSGAGRMWTGYPAYSISKAGLNVLTRLMAKTFAPKVRVNAIAPGLMIPAKDMQPGRWERLVEKLPMKKQGKVKHINDGINFLIRNDYITGQTIVIDGGYQLV